MNARIKYFLNILEIIFFPGYGVSLSLLPRPLISTNEIATKQERGFTNNLKAIFSLGYIIPTF